MPAGRLARPPGSAALPGRPDEGCVISLITRVLRVFCDLRSGAHGSARGAGADGHRADGRTDRLCGSGAQSRAIGDSPHRDPR